MAEDILEDLDDDVMEDILDGEDDLADDLDVAPEVAYGTPDKTGKTGAFLAFWGKLKDRVPSKLKSKKTFLISGVVLLAVIAAVVGLIFFLGGNGSEEETARDVTQAESAGGPQIQEVIFEDIVELAPFERISLKTSSTMGRITLNIALELTDHRYRKQIYSMEDRIRQIVTSQVAEMTWLELRNPEGKIRLKYDLLRRINSIFPKPTVRNVYFTYFIMQ